MPMTKDQVIAALKDVRSQIEDTASVLSVEQWSSGVYENGWNARELLCHLASDSVTTFLLALAQRPEGSTGGGEGFDLDAFNNQQVGLRSHKNVDDLLEEIRANNARDVRAVQTADEELLQKHFRAPWGMEGTLSEVIVESLAGHVGQHLAEVRAAVG